MTNNIIFKKDKGPDLFAICLCIFTIVLLVFQIAADRHISRASRDFIERARAKRVAALEKQRNTLREKELEAARALQQKEEDAYLANIETQFKGSGVTRQDPKKKTQTAMDYRKKLEIYRQAQAGK